MPLRQLFVAAAMTATVCAPAHGQQPPAAASPMMQHYRAYVAADRRGDYETAHGEAVAALEEAEKAGHPQVGALATNLARLRAFRFHNLEQARAPAARAKEAGGVDETQAALLVSLTQLGASGSTRTTAEASRALGAGLDAYAASAGADVDFLYEVAQAWGHWALAGRRRGDAVEAYQRASDYAARLGEGAALDRAAALTALGAAHLYAGDLRKSAVALNAAEEILAPLSPRSTGRDVPYPERLFYNVIAWQTVLHAKASSDGVRLPNFPSIERPGASDTPYCEYRILQTPKVEYPEAMLDELAVGGVVVRYAVQEDGRLHDVQVMATAPPSGDFARAVLAAVPTWRLEWKPSETPCRRRWDDGMFNFPFMFR